MGLERLGPLNACSEKKQLSREGQHRGGAGTGEDDGQDLSEWGHVLPKVLDSVLQALADHEAVIFLPSARLVNRNWHQWATHAVKVLDLKVTEPYAKMDRFARQFSKLAKLEIVSCRGISNWGMGMVGRLTYLKDLTLEGLPINDDGIDELSALTGLKKLSLASTRELRSNGTRSVAKP
eukprot:evm.model.scf_532.2 EVM.evm.TU.scf_532.2   scf_532:21737-25081(-)